MQKDVWRIIDNNSHFCCGIITLDGIVVDTAPIVKYMRDWFITKVEWYCKKRGWEIDLLTC
jgi:hypothetical protein